MRKLGIAALALLLALGAGALWLWPSFRAATGRVQPVYDTIPPQLPAEIVAPRAEGGLAILLFAKTSGFRHEDAIPACERSVRAIAERRGWRVFATENGAVFDAALLAHFDVVLGNNTTGDNWNAQQKAAFVRFIQDGGGFVGVHGAAGTRYEYWDWYKDELIGARFVGHPIFPHQQEAAVLRESTEHPASRALPARFITRDEWYSFAASPRLRGAHVLATIDESTYSPRALGRSLAMGDHPIVWTRCVARGRSFYSALGHSAATYALPEHETMLEGAIAWAADRSVCAENAR